MGHRTGVTRGSADTQDRNDWPGSPHEAARFILDKLPGCHAVEGAPPTDERFHHGDDTPVLLPPELLEGESFAAIRVADPRSPRIQSGFAAFLDGTQEVRVVNQAYGIPIVWATVSAAIRARVNRRLIAWKGSAPIVSRRYYIPIRYVDGLDDDMRANPRIVDTAKPDAAGNAPSRHPAALMEAAVQKVQQDREAIEIQLAESWCRTESSALYIDGSISGSAIASSSPLAVGVVKSHRRLYADGDAFRILVALDSGERSTAFKVSPRGRHPVASWYVRIRAAPGRDALFGLVRVEAALGPDISRRANEISRWIIAEGAPLALPDGRWDKMAYGIRDTEEFLRAIS